MASWLSSTLGRLALSGETEFSETAGSLSSKATVGELSVAVGAVVEVGGGGGGNQPGDGGDGVVIVRYAG
mgnify:CR=1 FL=1